MAISPAEGTITVLFTDVEGSTGLGTRTGDLSAREVLRRHDEIVRAHVRNHDGREIKSLGDGLMVGFSSARRAVLCAVDIQRALHELRNRGEDVPAVRMGINAGEVIHEEGDIFGSAVAAAARISAKATGGEIMVSEVVKALVGTSPDLTFSDRGRFRLKGFEDRWRLFEVQWRREPAAVSSLEKTPFVGREEERSMLVSLVEGLGTRRGGIALIGGEPGVGKTRLAEEVTAQARACEYRALIGRCYEMDSPPPYLPFVEILEGALKEVDRDTFRAALGDAGGEIAKIMPQLRTLYDDLPPPLELPPEQERRYLFNSIAEFVARAASARPLVITLDDLQWADESSLLLLQHLARTIDEIPVVLLGTYRDVELDTHRPLAKALDALVRGRLAQRITLDRMDVEGVRNILTRLSGRLPPPRLVDAIYSETDGNPFFIEEVFRHLSEEGRLFDTSGGWREDLSVDELDVPEGVRLVIGRRLDRLEDETRKALTAAAVAGRTFDFSLLEALGYVDADSLLDAVDEAERAGLIREVDPNVAKYEFVHELIRQTLLTSVSMPRRQRLHLSVAQVLEREHADSLGDRAGEIVNHLYQAGAAADEDRIASLLLLAGDRALEAAAFSEALRYFDEALALIARDDKARRADLLFRKGTAERSLGHGDEGLACWRECIGLYEDLGNHEALAEAARNVATQLGWAARWAEAMEVAGLALATLGEEKTAERANLLGTAALGLAWAGQHDSAWKYLEEAEVIAQENDDERIKALVGLQKSVVHYAYARFPESIKEGLECADRFGPKDAWPYATGKAFAMFALVLSGRIAEAEELVAEVEPFAARIGYAGASLFAMRTRGIIGQLRRFDLDTATRQALADRELCEKADLPWGSQSYAFLGSISMVRGEHDEAVELLKRSARDDPPGALYGWALGYLAVGYAYAGKREDLESLRPQIEELLPESGKPNTIGRWSLLSFVIEAYEVAGMRHRMQGLYELASQSAKTGVKLFYGTRLVETLVAVSAAAEGRWEESFERFESAIRFAEETPADIERFDARRFYASALLRRGRSGDPERARELLETAIDGYRALGASAFEDAARKLFVEAGSSTVS